ncbi:MAG TPA: DegT/DnrJ/EryC1/StrS family aminotransferase [Candidatus Acidoferrales bacterium]|nr:DegT/DnrJ/EryC1/StrS family aminotransferase [Candidatus Acidoferrales bacterium]
MGKLAITGGKALRKTPFTRWPIATKSEAAALKDVLESTLWGGQPFPGKHAAAFAAKFAKAHTAKYAQCVNTGTVAIQASLKAIGIKPGDEVIVPAYTWEGTVGPVLLVNAVPVFVDVDPDTYCLDAKLIEKAITPKTKAILPVHLGMRFADMDEILRLAGKHKLKVVEDCAHAHGGMWKGKGAGSMGDMGAFSFQSSKLITSGEGGAVITNNLEYMELVQSYINAGRASLTDKYKKRIIGFNYRLGEFQAAVLGAQLERMPKQSAIREKNMKRFEARLQKTAGIGLLKPDPRITRLAPYGYVIKYFAEKKKEIPRAAFVAAMQLEGVHCDGLFYEPVYKSSLFPVDATDFPALSWGREKPLDLRSMYSCPESEKAAYHEAVWFPHQHFLGTTKDVDDIADAIHKVLENVEELRGLDHKAIRNQRLGRADRES